MITTEQSFIFPAANNNKREVGVRFKCTYDRAIHIKNYLVKSDPELFDVVRRIRRVAFDAPRLADRLPGQCRRLNATYTHMISRAAGPRGPRVKSDPTTNAK